MPRKLSKFKVGVSISIVSTLFFLLIAELLARYLISDISTIDKFYLWSHPVLEKQLDGTITYRADAEIREVAVYDGEVEYIVDYQTNNLGLVDHKPYIQGSSILPSQKSYAFVGDSYLVGTGAAPWVPIMRDELKKKEVVDEIYNFGMIGAGFEFFLRSTRYYESRLRFSKLVIFAISDDFYRLYWRPYFSKETVRMCPQGETDDVCKNRAPFAHIAELSQNISSVAQSVRASRIAQQDQVLSQKTLLERVMSYSRIFSVMQRYLNSQPLFALAESEQKLGKPLMSYIFNQNMNYLTELLELFKGREVIFVHLPEKEEVRKGQYRLDLRKSLSSFTLKYFPFLELCPLEESDYHQFDPHPNSQGYAKIASCVEKLLFAES